MVILSIFPGIDLLGRAFEEAGYCVVRGPDVIWGGDIRTFHPPAGVFEGIIGGDPCQASSPLAHLVRYNGYEPKFPDMSPEYQRVVEEAQPQWYVRENVRDAPLIAPSGYDYWAILLVDAHVGGVQPRERRISFGMKAGLWTSLQSPMSLIEYRDGEKKRQKMNVMAGHDGKAPLSPAERARRRSVVADAGQGTTGDRVWPVVTAGHGNTPSQRDAGAGGVLSIEDACEAQGLPRDFTEHMPFTMHGKRSVIGNGVPLSMGRAIAAMVRRATP